MTERKAVSVLKKLAGQNKCAFREDQDKSIQYIHKFQDVFAYRLE